jgi:hypothetical protein
MLLQEALPKKRNGTVWRQTSVQKSRWRSLAVVRWAVSTKSGRWPLWPKRWKEWTSPSSTFMLESVRGPSCRRRLPMVSGLPLWRGCWWIMTATRCSTRKCFCVRPSANTCGARSPCRCCSGRRSANTCRTLGTFVFWRHFRVSAMPSRRECSTVPESISFSGSCFRRRGGATIFVSSGTGSLSWRLIWTPASRWPSVPQGMMTCRFRWLSRRVPPFRACSRRSGSASGISSMVR